MKIAICDDRKEDRSALKILLEEYGEDFEIREYDSGAGLCGEMEYIRECGIVFLDINMDGRNGIEDLGKISGMDVSGAMTGRNGMDGRRGMDGMDGMNGLEAARRIKEQCPKVHIVLISAYMNYALDGYKVKASRFLLKDDLEQTLQECMDDILQEIRQEERMVEFSFVEGNIPLRTDDIIYIETSRHKNLFYTKTRTFSIYRKMDELEEDLKGMGFVRIHQSFLINMKYIEKISSYVLFLTTGKEISVPKSRYSDVKRQYTLFKGAE